jgi:hypothetical protein
LKKAKLKKNSAHSTIRLLILTASSKLSQRSSYFQLCMRQQSQDHLVASSKGAKTKLSSAIAREHICFLTSSDI